MNDAQPQVNRAREATRAMSEEWHAEPGVLVMNTDGVIRRCDAGAEDLFGYQSCELVGVSVSGLFPYLFGRRLVSEGGDSIDSHIAYLCRCSGAFRGVRRDGTIFPASVCLNLVWPQQEPLLRMIVQRADTETGLSSWK